MVERDGLLAPGEIEGWVEMDRMGRAELCLKEWDEMGSEVNELGPKVWCEKGWDKVGRNRDLHGRYEIG